MILKPPGFWENEIVHVLGVLGTVFGEKKKQKKPFSLHQPV